MNWKEWHGLGFHFLNMQFIEIICELNSPLTIYHKALNEY